MLAGAPHSDSVEPEEQDEPGLPVVGEVVAGKYLIERRLGSGGMGIVVAARNILLDDAVAIKFLRPSAAKDEESVHRFVREAKSARRIQSDHVVRVQDVSYLEIGTPYMIMELLEGEDLGQLVESRGVLSVSAAVDLICEACSGIAEAHALGIVHRDIKPANMFLARRHDGSRVVKVLDFGISKAMEDGGAHNPNMTDTRATFGSPTYMSPEQIRSSKKVDFRTDIWALGVCLHEVLTARPPFLAETVAGLLASIIADAPVPIRQERPDIPAGLEAVILRCLEKDLNRRFQTIGDLVAGLRPFASAGAETSINRVLRLSPPSFLRSPSISPDVRGEGMSDALSVSDSYRAIASSPPGIRDGVSPSTGAPSYGQMRVDSSSGSARSDASIVHARTERNFTTSSSVAAPRNPAASSGRRTGIAVAVLLGALSLAAVGVGVGVMRFRHHDDVDPARGSAAAAGGTITPAPETSGTLSATHLDSSPAVPSPPSTTVTTVTPVAPAPPPTAPPVAAAPAHPLPVPGPRAPSHGRGPRPTVVGASVPASPPAPTPEPPAPTPPVKPSKDGTMNEQF